MAQYIDKDTLVAQIEKTEEISKDAADKAVDTYFKIHFDGWVTACRSILSFIDTLEVKEVDLDFMLHEYWNLSSKITIDCLESVTMTKYEMIKFAKHFFELGLKA